MFRKTGIAFLWAATLFGQAGGVRIWQDSIKLPYDGEKPPGPVPPFDQFEVAGTGNYYIYPYTLRNNLTGEKRDDPQRALHLQNRYLDCVILPDWGGHVYTCHDRLSGVELFYANVTLKKTMSGPRGAWAAGGIETSFPIAHARLSVSPVQFATVTNRDGSATVFVGAVDRISGMEWRVAYTLHPESAVLEQKVWLYNRGYSRQPFQYWTNAALRLPKSGHTLTYPMYVTAPHGSGLMDTWPVNRQGLDLTRTANYLGTLGLFAYNSREPFFGAYDPDTRTGVVHWADPKDVPGKKAWVWGRTDPYQDRMSDDHSGYTEIQAGLDVNQDEMAFLGPQESRAFTELWIPVRQTGGITRATPDAVLYMTRSTQPDGAAVLATDMNVTHRIAGAEVTVTQSGTVLKRQTADLDPAAAFHLETPVTGSGKCRFELKSAGGNVLLAHDEDHYDAMTPAEVKTGIPMAGAQELRDAEEETLRRGAASELIRNRDRAAAWYRDALAANPKSEPLRKAAGRLAINFGRFEEAAGLLAPGADDETAFYLGIAKSRLNDDESATALWRKIDKASPLFRAAEFQLACAAARKGDLAGAAPLLRTSAAAGAARSAGMEIAVLRRLGRTAEAKQRLTAAASANPLDSLLRNETLLLTGANDPALWERLAAEPEWVLDVVDDYFELGLWQDAIALLEREYPAVAEAQTEPGAVLPQAHPLIAYYRGYARMRLGQSPAEDFRKASGQSTLHVYPYRDSTAAVLRAAVKENPRDATGHYLLGCFLFSRRMTDEALAEWELAEPKGSEIPAYFEVVARVLAGAKKDTRRALQVIDEAVAANPSATGPKELGETLRRTAVAAAASSTVAAPAFTTPSEAVEYALDQLAQGRPGDAASVFTAKQFPGAKQPVEVRQAYIETQLRILLANAAAGRSCGGVENAMEGMGADNASLPFTFSNFTGLMKSPRFQFYIGLAQFTCGDRRSAAKAWAKVAKASAPPASPDYAFPTLAAALLDPARSGRAIETALERARTADGDRTLLLYNEGLLLRAAGRNDEAARKFSEGAANGSPFAKYLNGAALFDPPLPR